MNSSNIENTDIEQLIKMAEEVSQELKRISNKGFYLNMLSLLFVLTAMGSATGTIAFGMSDGFSWNNTSFLWSASILMYTLLMMYPLYRIEMSLERLKRAEKENMGFILELISDLQNTGALTGQSRVENVLLNMRLNRIRFGTQ